MAEMASSTLRLRVARQPSPVAGTIRGHLTFPNSGSPNPRADCLDWYDLDRQAEGGEIVMKISYYVTNLVEVISTPRLWPDWLLKTFVLSRPISYLLWLALWIVFIFCSVILIFFLWPIEESMNLWRERERLAAVKGKPRKPL
jgi:hypothetical protein